MSYIGRLSRLLPPPLHGCDVEPAGVNCLPPRAREKGRIAFVYTLWVGLAGEWRGKGRKIAGAAAAAASLLIMGGGSGGGGSLISGHSPRGSLQHLACGHSSHPESASCPIPFFPFLGSYPTSSFTRPLRDEK